MSWLDIEETDFQLENLPNVETEGKLSFVDWLEDCYGMTWAEYDINCPETETAQIEEEYESYYYDGLPKFVRKYL